MCPVTAPGTFPVPTSLAKGTGLQVLCHHRSLFLDSGMSLVVPTPVRLLRPRALPCAGEGSSPFHSGSYFAGSQRSWGSDTPALSGLHAGHLPARLTLS